MYSNWKSWKKAVILFSNSHLKVGYRLEKMEGVDTLCPTARNVGERVTAQSVTVYASALQLQTSLAAATGTLLEEGSGAGLSSKPKTLSDEAAAEAAAKAERKTAKKHRQKNKRVASGKYGEFRRTDFIKQSRHMLSAVKPDRPS